MCKPKILALPPLFANARGRARAVRANFVLRVELSRPLGKIIARRFPRPSIDARAFTRGLRRRTIGCSHLGCGIIAFQCMHDLRLIAPGRTRKLSDGTRACFSRQRVDEGYTPPGFVNRQAEHGGCFSLPRIAARPPALLGCHIATLHLGDMVPGIVTATFHGADRHLRCGQVIAQHLLLIESIGAELGESRISSSLPDQGRSLERCVLRIIAVALKMALGARQHHVIGAIVAEGLPLHHILGERRKRPLTRLPFAKIAGAKRPQRILLGKVMNSAGRGAGANRLCRRGIAKVAPDKRWRQPAQLSRRINAAQRHRAVSGEPAAMFTDHAAR